VALLRDQATTSRLVYQGQSVDRNPNPLAQRFIHPFRQLSCLCVRVVVRSLNLVLQKRKATDIKITTHNTGDYYFNPNTMSYLAATEGIDLNEDESHLRLLQCDYTAYTNHMRDGADNDNLHDLYEYAGDQLVSHEPRCRGQHCGRR